eukprot:423639_1
MTEPAITYSSLKTENIILKQKLEVFETLNKQNKTKYKEVELKLTLKYKQKEDILTNKLEELEDEIETQKQSIKLIQIDSFSYQSHEKQSLTEQNEQYQFDIKSLKHESTEQKTKISKLEKEIIDLKIINKSYKSQIDSKNIEIKSLKQKLELQSSINIQPISRHQSGTPMRINAKIPSAIAPKRTISRSKTNNISMIRMFRKQGTISATMTMDTRAQMFTIGATPIPLQQTTTEPEESMFDETSHRQSDMNLIDEHSKLTLKAYSTEKGAENDEKVLEIVTENDYETYEINEYKTQGGKLIIKQKPIDVKTHIWMNVFVELNKQNICIGIYLNKNCSIDLLIMLLQKSEKFVEIIGDTNVDIEVYGGNDDGELNDMSVLDGNKTVGSLGIMNICIKVPNNVDNIANVISKRENCCNCVVL